MIHFEEILEKVEAYNPNSDQELLRRAYVFSGLEHKGQVRRSGEPYLVHPLNVASILADLKADDVSIVVGLLHDVLEDTLTTKQAIAQQFGDEVADLVDGLTKIGKFSYVSREEEQAETFRKMLLAMISDLRVVLVKLADRLHNMRTLGFLPEAKRREIARETLDIYAPIAHRLGMGSVKGELEDLAFLYLEPEAHERCRPGSRPADEGLRDHDRRHPARASRRASRTPGIPAEVSGRMKRYYSIWLKMKRNGVEVAQLYDILAFRVVVPETRDCYATLGMVHQLWRPGARADQGLRRDAQAQLLPVAPHDGDRRDRPALRDPDPDPRDGPDRRAGDRGALEVQGGPARPARRRRPVPVAPAARRLAERGFRPAPVPLVAQGRPLPGRGLHVHAEGGGLRVPPRRDADRLRLPRPHGRRATAASARGSTASSCRCGRRSRAETSSRS